MGIQILNLFEDDVTVRDRDRDEYGIEDGCV